ncbi:hypothetical protein POX_a01025 [Penicillium oxalicum]|uniref:Uncharacterized protein n=1 Tax=Penicillium oxalicum (strain 114-2 / CGMCC 5302) TaxID=933388 RepID=S8B559_PENO1|nr:hypothetical protein POX_a01025 [Penicillium oxalicum]EPS33988.1 hypothetical protein PDE_08950 [Penicillium oxalicum 114-2]KAI2794426.1 hypothetical protein POX_a01025 [Penicillium oxalicum]
MASNSTDSPLNDTLYWIGPSSAILEHVNAGYD